MQITKSPFETATGPSDWFTGAVYIDAVAAPPAPNRAQANLVHFTPGARTAWHTHPLGQTIYVTEGIGLCQREGGAIEVIRPGERVRLPNTSPNFRARALSCTLPTSDDRSGQR
jgi:quercetin dioxygenase-like cupin family protein